MLLFTSARELGPPRPAALAGRGALRARLALEDVGPDAPARCTCRSASAPATEQGTFFGDHDSGGCREADDHDTRRRGPLRRPTGRCSTPPAPGKPISPNLAGRVAAAFALAAQLDARAPRPGAGRAAPGDPALLPRRHRQPAPPARHRAAARLLPRGHLARRHGARRGRDRAGRSSGLHLRSAGYVAKAAHWAHAYLAHETGDTLNLYDTSALAHADLVAGDGRRPAAPRRHPGGPGRRPARASSDAACGTRPATCSRRASTYDDFDVDSHTFGLIATAALYHQLTGTPGSPAFATAQRDWLLGANAWGVSFMVGVGTRFPRCMQHQVANLSGTTDGTAPLDVGAVVNGPNGADHFERRPRRLPGRHGALLRRRRRRCRASTATAAATSTTSAPGRPTSPRWT